MSSGVETATNHDLVGSWIIEGQVDDGPAFVNLSTFAPGGAAINTAGPGATAHGAWERTGEREYAITFVWIEWNDDGDVRGRGTIRGTLALDAAGDTFAGPFVTESTNAEGAVVETYRGSARATRVAVEPLPILTTP